MSRPPSLIQRYGGRCLHCLIRPAVGVHEIEPRGLSNSAQYRVEENQIPLCAECHAWAQANTQISRPRLLDDLKRGRLMFPYAS